MTIQFFFVDTQISLTDRVRLKTFLGLLFKSKRRALESLSYIFCTDNYLLEINRKFLKHDYYTDIISFDLAKKGSPVQGEIYISVDRVRENAKALGVPLKQELHHVIFHGSLHLCGYKDKTAKDKAEMTKEENRCLDQYFS